MWGADNQIYYVADPLANDKSVAAGSLDVLKSANNIYRIPVAGGQPVQVTKHTSGSLFWPQMSADGKVIVYEESFGVWKLDVASGRTSEIKIDIATDDKENEYATETVQNEVDAFDISPSGQRAVISVRGQLLTIATNRGDITRLAPDAMATRSQSPKWSPDGKYIAFVSDKSGRDEIWLSDPDGDAPKKITDLDNEKGAIVWTPDSARMLYSTADKRLYSYDVAAGKANVISSSDVSRINAYSVSPDSKWVALAKQDRTLRSHVYIVPITGGEERHVSDDRVLYSESSPVWTADGRHLVFISTESASAGIATQGGITATMELYALPLRDQDRDPLNRDIDNEAQALAAEAAGRGGRGGGAAAGPVTVQIDWNNLARRARVIAVPGDNLGGLVASPTGSTVALTVSTGGGRGGGGAAAAGPPPAVSTPSTSRPRRPRACRPSLKAVVVVPVEAAAAVVPGAAEAPATRCSRATGARSTSDRARDCIPRRSAAGEAAVRRQPRRRRAAVAAAAGGAAGAAQRPRRSRRPAASRVRSATRRRSRSIAARFARRSSTKAGAS